MASQVRSCSNTECRFATDGKCVEGYPLEECPHLNPISVEDIDEVEEAPIVQEGDRVMALASGEALDRAQASVLQRRRTSRAIAIIGPNDAGKTSLIASVYDRLQDGPVAGAGFAGSSTLIGFEKVCHDARAASRRGVPHTERTSVGADATFFHLDLRPSGDELVSLFIGDRSGEDYLSVTDEIARASEFFELKRADTVTLLVNGEHLASSEHRHEVKAITPQLVEALVEGGAIRRGSRLAVVLTKQDAVLTSANSDRVQREFDEMVTAIAERHRNHVAEVEPFIVAASPKDTAKVCRGEGVDKLLLYWLRAAAPSAPELATNPGVATRMIDLLAGDRERRA
ncbi:hypothetical protein [Mesorhizobium sp. ANAO-SY3R2]|uniref:TRAFAC clade GTPase domain-containing protein n=1 Tax=Mesorhizobium sp. ANAO-SY3R2 TaxID=3166644 RepID=UPI0036734982